MREGEGGRGGEKQGEGQSTFCLSLYFSLLPR